MPSNGQSAVELQSKWNYSYNYRINSLPSEEWAKPAKNLDAKYIAYERAFVHYGSAEFDLATS